MEGQQQPEQQEAKILPFRRRERAVGSEVVSLVNRGIEQDIHRIAGRELNLGDMDKDTLKLLHEQCLLRRDEAVFEAAIVEDYLSRTIEGGDGA